MKITEVLNKPLKECTAGATGTSSIATSMGGGNGFVSGGVGTISRSTTKRKTKSKK
jgi:hypothetical protein